MRNLLPLIGLESGCYLTLVGDKICPKARKDIVRILGRGSRNDGGARCAVGRFGGRVDLY